MKQKNAEWRRLSYIVGRPRQNTIKRSKPESYTQLPLELSPGYPQVIHKELPEVDGELSPGNDAPTT